MIEFDCADCGQHIMVFGDDRLPEGPFCLTCLYMPGWFKDPKLRAIFDPDNAVVVPE